MGLENSHLEQQEDISNDYTKKLELIIEQEGFDGYYFLDLYDTLSLSEQKAFFDVFEKYNENDDIVKFIQSKGFPYDKDSMFFFIEKISGSGDSEKQNKEELIKIEKEKFISFCKEELFFKYPDFFSNIDINNASFEDYKTIVEEKYELILQKAEENPEDFNVIYEKFKSWNDSGILNLSGLDSYETVYKELLIKGDNHYGLETGKLVDYSIDKSDYFKTEVEGDRVIYGNQVIDLSENPPIKYLKSGEYELKSSELEYRENPETLRKRAKLESDKDSISGELEIADNQLGYYSKIKSDLGSLDLTNKSYLESLLSHDISNPSINLQIESLIDDIDSGADITNKVINLRLALIENVQAKIDNIYIKKDILNSELIKIEESLNEIEQNLNQAKAEYIRKLKEKDEKTRDTLRFLSSIGFDEIPQSVTDMIIETLNSSSTLANSLGFTTKINLEEGLLGTDTNMDNKKDSLGEKVKFAKFVNILISGSEDIPLNINNLKADSGVAIDDITLFRASLQESGLLDTMTGYGTAMTRLKSHQIMPTTKSTTQENPKS